VIRLPHARKSPAEPRLARFEWPLVALILSVSGAAYQSLGPLSTRFQKYSHELGRQPLWGSALRRPSGGGPRDHRRQVKGLGASGGAAL